MIDELTLLKDNFNKNVLSVETLLKFDIFILDYSINVLESVNNKLRDVNSITNPYLTAEGGLKALKNIKDNNSISLQYNTIYNQALVLLVSYYTSTIKDIFSKSLFPFLNKFADLKIFEEEIKMTVEQIKLNDFNLSSQIADLIILKKGYSFQDMKSTTKALNECFAFEFEKNNHINNIILGQACRHSIVHNGGKVDQQLQNQIKNAFPRDVKCTITEDNLSFLPDEVLTISASMGYYLDNIINWVNKKCS